MGFIFLFTEGLADYDADNFHVQDPTIQGDCSSVHSALQKQRPIKVPVLDIDDHCDNVLNSYTAQVPILGPKVREAMTKKDNSEFMIEVRKKA